MFRRRLFTKISDKDESVVDYYEVKFTNVKQSFSLNDIFKNLINDSYKIDLYIIGSGGDAGLSGKENIFYWGGSGGSGANGNIIKLNGKIQKNKKFIFETNNPDINIHPRNFKFTWNNKIVCEAFGGGNGTNGGDASLNPGQGGTGGIGKETIINNANLGEFTVIDNYFDLKGNNGKSGGSGADIISPNLIDDMTYGQYAFAGTASPDNKHIKGANGGVFIKLYRNESIIQRYTKTINIKCSSNKEDISISKLLPNMKDSTYTIDLWCISSGGTAGTGGNNWLWYHGGSGGSGSNGNIVQIEGRVNYTDVFTIENTNYDENKRPRAYTIYLNGKKIIQTFAGGNGTNGEHASAGGGGKNGGKGGIGKEPFINLSSTSCKVINKYFDPKGNNGNPEGVNNDVISPNPIPNIKYSEYAVGGSATYNNGNINGQSGALIIKIYYTETQIL